MNNTVLVTGSSKGIGKAIAIELAKSGFDIVVHYNSDIKGAQETLTQVNLHQSDGNSRIVQFDIANEEQSRQVLTSDIAEFGAYYGVVCNAGVHSDNAFPSMTSDEWHKVIHTNLDGFYNVVHPLIMRMIQRTRLPLMRLV